MIFRICLKDITKQKKKIIKGKPGTLRYEAIKERNIERKKSQNDCFKNLCLKESETLAFCDF